MNGWLVENGNVSTAPFIFHVMGLGRLCLTYFQCSRRHVLASIVGLFWHWLDGYWAGADGGFVAPGLIGGCPNPGLARKISCCFWCRNGNGFSHLWGNFHREGQRLRLLRVAQWKYVRWGRKADWYPFCRHFGYENDNTTPEKDHPACKTIVWLGSPKKSIQLFPVTSFRPWVHESWRYNTELYPEKEGMYSSCIMPELDEKE